MKYDLVLHTAQILKQECEVFDFFNPPEDPVEFAKNLVETMHEKFGLGLAANQVGKNYRCFAMRGSPQNLVCFNPKVVWTSEKEVVLEEACLSYPGLAVKIKRPEAIRVRFNTPNSDVMTQQFIGLTARCFLHELDHLNGVIFYEKANRYHRDLALKQWSGWKRRNNKSLNEHVDTSWFYSDGRSRVLCPPDNTM
jgi:peptide deformylase